MLQKLLQCDAINLADMKFKKSCLLLMLLCCSQLALSMEEGGFRKRKPQEQQMTQSEDSEFQKEVARQREINEAIQKRQEAEFRARDNDCTNGCFCLIALGLICFEFLLQPLLIASYYSDRGDNWRPPY
ncbi:MAG: hypothetical protein AB7R69_04800 [Candidatus Babeliales bacterium]